MASLLSYLPGKRLTNLSIFLFCAAMMGIAYYMQYSMGLQPCHLCIMQRVFFTTAGLIALAAFVHNPGSKGVRIYGVSSVLLAVAGSGFALRQIWLQHLPKDQVPACGPSLSYMLEEFPLAETLKVMFSGDGNCAEIAWVDPVIGLGIPEWAIVGFTMIAVTGIYQAVRK
jgi:disulfide bond formation protein DsbB